MDLKGLEWHLKFVLTSILNGRSAKKADKNSHFMPALYCLYDLNV